MKIDKKILLVILVSLMIVNLGIAQDSVGDAFGFEEEGGSNVDDAPINFLIPLALLVGAYFGVKKNEKISHAKAIKKLELLRQSR